MDTEKKKPNEGTFLAAMADVTPLQAPDRIEPVPKKTPALALQRASDERAVMRELLNYQAEPAEFETGEELLFLRPGYQRRVLRRLRNGHYSVADTIDLHHLDVETAKQVLMDFLDHVISRQQGCLRVIHGKGLRSRGLPRLKMMTNQLLRKHPRVVAFASCRPVDGGTGATDVLLSARPGKAR